MKLHLSDGTELPMIGLDVAQAFNHTMRLDCELARRIGDSEWLAKLSGAIMSSQGELWFEFSEVRAPEPPPGKSANPCWYFVLPERFRVRARVLDCAQLLRNDYMPMLVAMIDSPEFLKREFETQAGCNLRLEVFEFIPLGSK